MRWRIVSFEPHFELLLRYLYTVAHCDIVVVNQARGIFSVRP